MEVLKELIEEHAHILKGLSYLEAARDALERNLSPPSDFFKTAVLFFSAYADRLHHYKEEYLLFSLLASKKGGKIDLEIGALRHQHEKNRRSIRKIKDALKGYETKSEIAVTTLLENLAAYISILKRHIHREDQLFFPMAKAELSEAEKKMLQTSFLDEETGSDAQEMVGDNMARLRKMKHLISQLHGPNEQGQ